MSISQEILSADDTLNVIRTEFLHCGVALKEKSR